MMENHRNVVVYVAGPYRAKTIWGILLNIIAAYRQALYVWKMGATALCPHGNTAPFQGECPDEVWLDGDLILLSRCDAVLMVPGWEISEGASVERSFAIDRGIPVFLSRPDFEKWLSSQPKEEELCQQEEQSNESDTQIPLESSPTSIAAQEPD